MPVAESDIVVYGSALMPDDDASVNIGGGIDLTTRISFVDIAAPDQVEIFSDSAGDTTQTVTLFGRNVAGELVSDAVALNGVSVVVSTLSFERILKIVVSAAHAGNITLRDQDTDTEIAAIEPGVLQIRRPFYGAAADAAAGAERKYHEKIFFRNNHAILSLTSA
jgi:hypothetical protein